MPSSLRVCNTLVSGKLLEHGREVRKPVEMLHWHVAMGCVNQHHFQKVMLARVRDMGLAQTLVRVVHRVMCVGHVRVRCLCKDVADIALLHRLWCESNSLVRTEPLLLVNPDVLDAAKFVGAGTAFVGCMPFLEALLSAFPSLLELLPAVTSALQSEVLDVRGDRRHEPVGAVEVKVLYTHESLNCQVPPAEVCLPGLFAASLFWGGVSSARNMEWLRWRGVTHVLNCMGSIDPSTGNTEHNYALALAARSSHIEYIDWCIKRAASRNKYLSVFS